jgi:hypothetical protein
MPTRLLQIALLLFSVANIHAQGGYGTDYFEFEQEFRKVLVNTDRQNLQSFTASYNMDSPPGHIKGKIRVTFLNDSVFTLKDHTGKETYVFRGKNFFPYNKNQPLVLSGLEHLDSADCDVYWGTPYDDSAMVSYCRIKHDSSGRMLDYYFTFNHTMTHMVYTYEGDSAYFSNTWKRVGDSIQHTEHRYVYEYYSADSSFYTRVIKIYTNPDDSASRSSDIYASTRTYLSYDKDKRVSEIRIETADQTNGKESIGVLVHRMKFTYKLR